MQGQIINNAQTVSPYVGLDNCETFEKQPIGVILTNSDYILSNVDEDVADRLLKSAALEQGDTKVFPIMEGMVNLEPSGGDARVSQEGFGSGSINGLNPYSEILTFIKGGLCLYKQLTALHGRDMRVYFVDQNYNAYGVMLDDGTVRGFAINFGVAYRKNVGTTTPAVKLHLLYSSSYATELQNITSFKVSDSLVGLRAINWRVLDITYDAVTNITSIKAGLFTQCSGINVTSLLSSVTKDSINIWVDNVWKTPTLMSSTIDSVTFTVPAITPADGVKLRSLNLVGSVINTAFCNQLVSLKMSVIIEDIVIIA
jgi:hypothetical protein